jgi:hypothetical protein
MIETVAAWRRSQVWLSFGCREARLSYSPLSKNPSVADGFSCPTLGSVLVIIPIEKSCSCGRLLNNVTRPMRAAPAADRPAH